MTHHFAVTVQAHRNGTRIADVTTVCTGATAAQVAKRWRGYRIVSVEQVAAPLVPANQTGLSGCGVHSFYMD